MTIDSIETVLLTCIFIVPGFIIDGITNSFYPPPKRNEAVHFLYYLFYSTLNCAVLSWAYYLIWSIKVEHPIWFIVGIFFITFIGAIILGVIIGLFKGKELFRKFLNKCKCNVRSAIPTAWDYFFAHQGSLFLIVTLMDDSKIYGFYGTNSFTSSDPDERDIYIEKIYDIDEDNNWIENQQSLGVHINPTQIKTIEFLEGEFNDGTEEE